MRKLSNNSGLEHCSFKPDCGFVEMIILLSYLRNSSTVRCTRTYACKLGQRLQRLPQWLVADKCNINVLGALHFKISLAILKSGPF